MTKVSIIIPAYNASDCICNAVDSIVKQRYEDVEIIIVDDGSTDQTRKVLEKYTNNNTIKYIHQTNAGPGAARNTGMQYASGEYVGFLDSDDELLEGSLKKRVRFLEDNIDVGMVFTDFYKFKSSDDYQIHFQTNNFLFKFDRAIISNENNVRFVFGDKFFECALEYNPFVLTSTVLMRAETAKRIGAFNTQLFAAEDVDYWLRICRQYKLGFLNEPLSKYNNYRSILTKNVEKFFEHSIQFYSNLLEEVHQNTTYKYLLKKKLSVLEFNYGYHLFYLQHLQQAKMHFRISLGYIKLNRNAIKWSLITLFPSKALKKMFRF